MGGLVIGRDQLGRNVNLWIRAYRQRARESTPEEEAMRLSTSSAAAQAHRVAGLVASNVQPSTWTWPERDAALPSAAAAHAAPVGRATIASSRRRRSLEAPAQIEGEAASVDVGGASGSDNGSGGGGDDGDDDDDDAGQHGAATAPLAHDKELEAAADPDRGIAGGASGLENSGGGGDTSETRTSTEVDSGPDPGADPGAAQPQLQGPGPGEPPDTRSLAAGGRGLRWEGWRGAGVNGSGSGSNSNPKTVYDREATSRAALWTAVGMALGAALLVLVGALALARLALTKKKRIKAKLS
eukprot:tig00000215_g18550.t1